MLITRLYLRNFRVYEDELDLELPPGLVGIYGPNGAGKSTLLEAVLFTLWGRARTGKDEIRSAGVGGDCVTEVEFEHEGHLYLVRRILAGINSTARAEAHCDGLILAEGVRETARYLHSVLGMDDAAFRASVFAEQKQLTAFSAQSPAERRRLVLQLLGITPLDSARDTARKDARQRAAEHDRLRQMLPDLDSLTVEAADADAHAGAVEAEAKTEAAAAEQAATVARSAADEFASADQVRQAYDTLVVEGKAARQQLDRSQQEAADLERDLAGLSAAQEELAALEATLVGAAEAEQQLEPLRALGRALTALSRVELPPEPPPPDTAAVEAAVTLADAARAELDTVAGLLRGATDELARARAQADRSASLSSEEDCPMCGQPLGSAFLQVQEHRASEVATCERRVQDLTRRQDTARATAQSAKKQLEKASAAHQQAVEQRSAWEQARDRRVQAEAEVEQAEAAANGIRYNRQPEAVAGALSALERQVRTQRAAAAAAERLRGQLDGRERTEARLADARRRVAAAEGEVQALRERVRALGFSPTALDEIRLRRDATASAANAAQKRAQEAHAAAVRERTRAEGAAKRLADAVAQHDKLEDLQSESRHLSRVADLLSEFRNTVVGTVGPRLAVQAAELFGELTDHEYDELLVDPETYELQIRDAGRVYGLDRFSGSEVDLANLALRVAISEHVRFQSGGSVGLLVLDEVFGPLDEDRKHRTLLALERLRSRFRQVLVVTHDATIKEQLPNALEIVKRPGRRATARLVGS